MKLFTKVEIGEIPHKIQHSDRILTLGSCFSENIGQRLLTNKFHITCNPFGIIYNPVSISKSLNRIANATSVTSEELLLCQKYYCHLEFHSQHNRLDKQATLKSLNTAISSSHAFANEGIDWLFVTLGTSFVYRHLATNQIVANCHKIPAKEFTRELLETSEILTSLKQAIAALKKRSPQLKTIFTVSPIRHTRDGLQQNARSKARLVDAANEMAHIYPDCYYYPAYEIMTDELRDYRWYEADLIHPNQQAIDYIWNQFKIFALSEKSKEMITKIEALHRNLNHRPFLKESEEYQTFLKRTEQQMDRLKAEDHTLNFIEEETTLKQLKQA